MEKIKEFNDKDKPVSITITINDYYLLERLNNICSEVDKDWNFFVNLALEKVITDFEEFIRLWTSARMLYKKGERGESPNL